MKNNPLHKFKERDFDHMITEMVECNGDGVKFATRLLQEGYDEKTIVAFCKTIDFIKDSFGDNEEKSRLAAIKGYCILRINCELMDDEISSNKQN